MRDDKLLSVVWDVMDHLRLSYTMVCIGEKVRERMGKSTKPILTKVVNITLITC